ncbi:hypothetical protein H6P81_000046 [Aristolochia fimbriata]|uniref:Importin N-terminal domain-containing protein n=1 Tax=Aristolochia fimbriata TaxID=158543 RepID=A0AAV7F7J8_ARIFI|nr:hypothetical protein H6P81_000046 [Aristolochia fimbriata]
MAQSLELLLIQFLMPDNDARRQAEEQIKRLAKDPQVIPALLHHLRTAKTPNVRQLAAVLLRKKITGHWAKLSPQLRHSVKAALIDSITLEHSPPVRRASANVVSIIAKYAVPAGEWPDLLPFLFQCSQSGQEDHREVALILFSSLTETIGNTFQQHFGDLHALLLKCLQDETSTRVRVAALKAVGSFMEFVNDGADVVKFREFVPSILNVSRQCLANGEEDVATIAFEIFDELIESPAPLLGESIKSIVHFSLEVSSCKDLDINTRHQAIQLVSWLAKYKPISLKKHGLVLPILQVMCLLLVETHGDEDDDLAIDRSAAEVIDTMAVNIAKHVFPPILEFASTNIRNINPKYREASVTALGVISEGCFELMKEKLEPVLHMALAALKDHEQMVRGAASFALGQFAEHLQPEIVSHYESVLPCILSALDDGSEEVKEKSYYALAAFCENMGEEILPYLDPLMGRLLSAIQSSPRNLQETCMSAIGSVAAAAEQAFIPFAEKVLELMKVFMVLTNDEDLCSRARATELVGIVAMAVGRTRIEPVLPPFIEAAISGFALDFSELREYTHGFFSNIAEIMGESFTQYLPRVVPLVFSSCNLDDGSAVDIDESDGEDNTNGFGGVSSDDEAHDEPRERNISVRTGVLDEKAAATQAIGQFALHTKSSYAPYLEESLKILVRHSGYFHEDVRLQAIIGLKHILTATLAINAGFNEEVSAKKKEVFGTVMDIYIKTMTGDDDKEVVAQACTDAADIIKDCGYMDIEPYVPRLVDATWVLLREESACQQVESDSEAEDDAEHDEVLMDAVSDLLPAFAKSMGSHFEPVLAKLFEPLMKFAKSSRPPQDRTMVVACLAEVAQGMGSAIEAYVDKVMSLVLKELASSEAANRRNAAFCVGELCKNGGSVALKYYGDVLRGLYPLFGDSEPDDAVRDNAAGAVARMILVNPQSIPLNQVLPVFLKVLPLREDREESMAVYGCVCQLVLASNPQILSHVPELVRIIAEVVSSPEESSDVKMQVQELGNLVAFIEVSPFFPVWRFS